MKKLIMLLLAALPLVAVAQTELTPEQELEKAQKELEAAQRKLTEARERAQKAQQTQGEAPRKEENAGWTVPQNQTPVAKKQDPAEKRKEAKPSKAEDLAPYLVRAISTTSYRAGRARRRAVSPWSTTGNTD